MPEVRRIETSMPGIRKRKRVAAYARVSKESDKSFKSLSNQVSSYSSFIQKNPEWEYAGVYADDGISGTGTTKRSEFRRLISDCEAGKIDIVLTKSISRFARNTVDLLETVRHLKDIGVEVRFENENISTMSGDGELMLTILASFAQAEAEAVSTNIKWSVQKKFREGEPFGGHRFLGYRWDAEQKKYIVVPDEAELVRHIYDLYLSGESLKGVTERLREEGISSFAGSKFYRKTISIILQNYTYTGNLLLQKVYSHDPLTKRKTVNNGELPMYHAENTHEAIIDMETFERTQRVLEDRRRQGSQYYHGYGPFTHRVFCGCCGEHYSRERSRKKDWISYRWICTAKLRDGAAACSGKNVPERALIMYSCEVLGWDKFDEEIFKEAMDRIVVIGDDQLDFYLADGRIIHKKWDKDCLKTMEGRANAERYCNTRNDKQNDSNADQLGN